MIPRDIKSALLALNERQARPADQIQGTIHELAAMGLSETDQIFQFYTAFKALGIRGRGMFELLDVFVYGNEVLEQTEYARLQYDLKEGFLCLSTGEGQAYYVYQIESGAVFEAAVWQLEDMDQGRLVPRWGNFFDYLRTQLNITPYEPSRPEGAK